MTALNCTYLDGAYSATLDVGRPEETLRHVLKRAKEKYRVRFGHGVLKVDGVTKTLADLDRPLGKAERIEFFEIERSEPVDLDSL